jgi:predicted CXXCH cytochrome family protein
MKHQFDEVGLPGCTTCHGSHDIRSPSDEMLGMSNRAVCFHCHAEGRFGAPLAEAQVVVAIRRELERLKAQIGQAEAGLSHAARLGMEVSEPRFRLRRACSLLTNARCLLHGFELNAMRQCLDEGLAVADGVVRDTEQTLRKHTGRRIGLGVSVIPILGVILLLLRCIRRLPPPSASDNPGV